MDPDFRYLLAGIVMADLAAKQIALAANGIVAQINELSDKLEE